MPDDRLVRVYTAADAGDAHLVRDLLAAEGVRAVIQGENLSMARGEIPLGPTTAPSVWVREGDVPQARALIEAFERPTPSQRPAWTCPNCGERIEGQFSECWRCG